MARKKPSLIGETARTVIFAVVIAFFIRVFAYEPFNIPSGSMIPTLLVGDYLFVSKFSYGYSRYSLPWGLAVIDDRILASPPKRGDVVVFKLPKDNQTDYIKRVIGLPGDTVQVIGGILHINGTAVARRSTPGQRHGRLAARQVDHAQVAPVDAVPGHPGAQRLGAGLLGGEALGVTGRPGRAAVGFLLLDRCEHPIRETAAEAIEGFLDAADVDQVVAEADDHGVAFRSGAARAAGLRPRLVH